MTEVWRDTILGGRKNSILSQIVIHKSLPFPTMGKFEQMPAPIWYTDKIPKMPIVTVLRILLQFSWNQTANF